MAAELAAGVEWARDGSATAAHWIADALDVEVCTAREWVRIGQTLTTLPLVDSAFAEGRLSFSKVRALTRVATPEHEAELCDLAERVPSGQLATVLARWRACRESPEDTEARHHAHRSVTYRTEPDGMICGTFLLPPLEGGRLIAVLEADTWRPRTVTDPSGSVTVGGIDATADASLTLAQMRADSLARLAHRSGARVDTEVIIHVRGDGTTLDDGTPIPDTVVERIAPESFLRVMIHDCERRPINASGRHRHPTTRQKLVVKERDRVCVDCGTSHFLEHDHVPEFEITGHTHVDELQLRCSHCHHTRHRRTDVA